MKAFNEIIIFARIVPIKIYVSRFIDNAHERECNKNMDGLIYIFKSGARARPNFHIRIFAHIYIVARSQFTK